MTTRTYRNLAQHYCDKLTFSREFATRHGLDGNTGGGAHMWRQVWDEGVPLNYTTIPGPFPYSVTGLLISHPFQDEKNLNLRCHPSQTVTRISVASGDTSIRLPTLQIEWIQAEYTFLLIFLINLAQLLSSINAKVLRDADKAGGQIGDAAGCTTNSPSQSTSWRSGGIRPCVSQSTSQPGPCRS